MRNWVRIARRLIGLLIAIGIFGLVVVETNDPSITLVDGRVAQLLGLAMFLLFADSVVDILVSRVSSVDVGIVFKNGGDDEGK